MRELQRSFKEKSEGVSDVKHHKILAENHVRELTKLLEGKSQELAKAHFDLEAEKRALTDEKRRHSCLDEAMDFLKKTVER